MGKRFLIDTNILIYYGNNQLSQKSADIIEVTLLDSFNISVITKLEYLGWRKHTEETYSAAVEFLSNANVISLDEDIISSAIKIMRGNNIRLPDAIIASTAIANKFALLTRNESDFKCLRSLQSFNPFM